MHLPVLLNEAIDALAIKPHGNYVDGTFGRGGHAQAILAQLTTGRLLVIDKDQTAIEHAKRIFAGDDRVIICQGSFSEMATWICQFGLAEKISGVLLDLGVSSPQLDEAERGFSFLRDGALDMRMNPQEGLSAAEWLAQVDEKVLAEILYELGEERYSRRIARAIVLARETQAITRTKQLADIVAKAHPSWEKHKHPATRSFQAIRIYLNRELEDLAKGLEESVAMIEPEGRLVVISFHSLEDRIVKRFIERQVTGPELPRGLPISEKDLARYRRLKKVGRAIRPTEEEVKNNPRARSAVMRVTEKRML